jgi:hypothetical protein
MMPCNLQARRETVANQRRETVAQQKQHPKQAAPAKQTAAKKPAAAKPAVKRQKTPVITPEERQNMIAEEAYIIAEQRGFEGDMALSDWLQAEATVDARFEVRH